VYERILSVTQKCIKFEEKSVTNNCIKKTDVFKTIENEDVKRK
jgi:hypothetical protein